MNRRRDHSIFQAGRIRMNGARALLILLLTLFCRVAQADPYVGYVYPAGIAPGKKSFVLVGGQNLNGARSLVSDCPGLRLVATERVPYLHNFIPKDQRQYLSRWLEGIRSGNGKAPSLEGLDTESWRKNDWWDHLDTLKERHLRLIEGVLFGKRRDALQVNPSLNQCMLVELEVDSDVAPGCYELRLAGNGGVSEPRNIYIDSSRRIEERGVRGPYHENVPIPRVSSFPCMLDGQIMPGETDEFEVVLEKGKNYVFSVTGQKLQPFIGDAVPGHFQPVLCLTDDEGREVAFADDRGNDPDPVLSFKAGKRGTYRLKIRDNLYRGREDFVYRIEALEGKGRGNPSGMPVEWKSKCKRLDSLQQRHLSVKDRFVAGMGVIRQPGQTNRFNIDVDAGETLVFEVLASALGSPLDSVMRIRDSKGNLLAENDDVPHQLNVGRLMQWTDSLIQMTFPKKETCSVEIFDRTGKGNERCFYWLRVARPQPSFDVYTSVSSLLLNKQMPLTFRVERKEGFKGDVAISSPDVQFREPPVIKFPATEITAQVSIPKNNNKINGSCRIDLFARAVDAPPEESVNVIPADEYIQAFAYTHLMPAKGFYVTRPQWNQNKKQKQNKK